MKHKTNKQGVLVRPRGLEKIKKLISRVDVYLAPESMQNVNVANYLPCYKQNASVLVIF